MNLNSNPIKALNLGRPDRSYMILHYSKYHCPTDRPTRWTLSKAHVAQAPHLALHAKPAHLSGTDDPRTKPNKHADGIVSTQRAHDAQIDALECRRIQYARAARRAQGRPAAASAVAVAARVGGGANAKLKTTSWMMWTTMRGNRGDAEL